MRRRIYLASSWRNRQQPEVVIRLQLAGHEVYDFRNPAPGNNGFHWSEIDPRWKEWRPRAFRESLLHATAERGFATDLAAMQRADTCVLLLPAGRSAHLEGGWFAGSGRELYILMSEADEPELMYKFATAICVDVDELIGVMATRAACVGIPS